MLGAVNCQEYPGHPYCDQWRNAQEGSLMNLMIFAPIVINCATLAPDHPMCVGWRHAQETGLLNLMALNDSDSEEDEDCVDSECDDTDDLMALRYIDPRQYEDSGAWMADVYDTTEDDLIQLYFL